MTLSFDPDTLALDARHFIGGAAVAGAAGMALTARASDGARPRRARPTAGAEIVDRAVETAQRALRSSRLGHRAAALPHVAPCTPGPTFSMLRRRASPA